MAKSDIRDFVFDLLGSAGCRGIHQSGPDDVSAQCPFHWPMENTSAFGVSISKEDEGYPFNCYSCGERGNIIQLISHVQNIPFKRAQKVFRKKVAVTPINLNTLNKLMKELTTTYDVEEQEVIDLPMRADSDRPMLDYMKWRNKKKMHSVLDIRYTINKYDLYYCEYGSYTDRIIMPIRDHRGEVICFNNRHIADAAKIKTKHPKGIDITDYVHGVYESLGRDVVVVVEGPFDMFQVASVIRKRQLGLGVVNVMGVLITEQRAAIISELFKEALVLFDHDQEYDKDLWIQKKRSVEMLAEIMKVRDISNLIPKGKDPAICRQKQILKAIQSPHTLRITKRFKDYFN